MTNIKTNVTSGDSNAKLEVIVPLESHPQNPKLKRAVDPDTGWKGWVEYEEPVVPRQENIPRKTFKEKLKLYIKKKDLVNLGLFSEDELDLDILREELRSSFDESWL